MPTPFFLKNYNSPQNFVTTAIFIFPKSEGGQNIALAWLLQFGAANRSRESQTLRIVMKITVTIITALAGIGLGPVQAQPDATVDRPKGIDPLVVPCSYIARRQLCCRVRAVV